MPSHRRFPRVASGASRRREAARELTTQVADPRSAASPGRCSARPVREDVDDRAAALAQHEASDSPVFIAQGYTTSKPRSATAAWTASTSATSTEIPGAAMSSLPTMVTCAEELLGDARVTTQPRSITTSKPRSTKKSRVAAGRSDLMFGTVLL